MKAALASLLAAGLVATAATAAAPPPLRGHGTALVGARRPLDTTVDAFLREHAR
jgi:hypothetical protein